MEINTARNIEMKDWFTNGTAINAGFHFSRYIAKQYIESARVASLMLLRKGFFKTQEERKDAYNKAVEKINSMILK